MPGNCAPWPVNIIARPGASCGARPLRIAGADTRPAPPDAAAVKKAAGEVDEVYSDQLAKAHDAESKAAIAKSILKSGVDETDPVAKFALLNKSIDVAVQAGDMDTAVAALDVIESIWNINSLKLRTTTFTELSRHLRNPASRTALSRRLLSEAGNAISSRQYDAARELNDVAVATARRGDDPTLTDQLAGQAREIARLIGARSRIDAAITTLKTTPDDPVANFAVGRFECFDEADWKTGLPKLALGTDARIKVLAEKEQTGLPTTADRVLVADGWWDLSKKEEEPHRSRIQAHAAELYRNAIPGMSGLAKLRAQQRVDVAMGQADVSGITGPTEIQVVNLTDAREAGEIVAQVERDYPDVLKDVKSATLAWYHDGGEYKHRGGPSMRMPGSFSLLPVTAQSNAFLFWGVSDQFKMEKYLVVLRAQSLAPADNGRIATMDVFSGGKSVAGRPVDAKEFKPGQWSVLPIIAAPTEAEKAECRMFTDAQHSLALDRVYVYELR